MPSSEAFILTCIKNELEQAAKKESGIS